MLTLLGSLLGFLSSAFPKIFEFFQQREDNKLKMQMLQAQLEAQKAGQEFSLKIFHETKDFEEQRLLLQHDIAMKDNKLSASVRPIITYLFFFIFATVKISMILHAYTSGDNFTEVMAIAWTEEDQAIWAALLSYWFGNRAFQKMKK